MQERNLVPSLFDLCKIDNNEIMYSLDNDAERLMTFAIVEANLYKIDDLLDKGVNIQDMLIIACQKKQLGVVKHLVDKGVNLNKRSTNGKAALIEACEKGYYDIVEYLVESGADVNIMNIDGDTLLGVALKNGHTDIAKYLLYAAERSITFAIMEANLYKIDDLLDKGVNIQDMLIIACQKKQLGVVKHLVDKGVNLNKRSTNGKAALIEACEKGYYDIVEYLVESGANVDIINMDGATPLGAALENGHTDIAEYLLDKGVNINKVLLRACRRGYIKVVEVLLEQYKANIETVNKIGDTPLIVACKYKKIDIVKYLLEKERDVSKENKYGETALTVAKKKGYKEIIRLIELHLQMEELFEGELSDISDYSVEEEESEEELIESNLQMEELSDILNYSVKEEESEEKIIESNLQMEELFEGNLSHISLNIVKFLIENDIDVNENGINCSKALIVASEKGHYDTVQYMVEHEVNMINVNGDTALVLALKNKHNDVASYLLNHGADVNKALLVACTMDYIGIVMDLVKKHKANIETVNKKGDTPLIVACKYGKSKIVEYLLDEEALIDVKNNEGETALTVAKGKGYTEIVSLIEDKEIENELNLSAYEILGKLIANKENVKNNEGEIALTVAKKKGYTEIVSLIEDKEIENIDANNSLVSREEQEIQNICDLDYWYENCGGYEEIVSLIKDIAIQKGLATKSKKRKIDNENERCSKHLKNVEKVYNIPCENILSSDKNKHKY